MGARRVFLINAILGIALVLGAVPLMASAVALCPSYPLTAWLASDRWTAPSFRWGVAPLVAGFVGFALYRRLRRLAGSRPGGHLVRSSFWGIAFGLLYAWLMGGVEAVVTAASGRPLEAGDVPVLVSVLLFSPPMLLAYPRALRCAGLASLAVVAGGTCVGIANGLLVRWSGEDRLPPPRTIRLRERLGALTAQTRWMWRTAAIAAGLLAVVWAVDYLRLVPYPIPFVILAPHGMGSMPSFSPDGSKIVHVREGDVYVMDADGANPVRLAGNPAAKRRPSYSPDGRSIVYVSDLSPREAEGGRPYVMDADGGRSRRLGERDPDLWGVDHPVFSPDGSRIACTIHGGRSIYVLDVDGSNGTTVASLVGVTDVSFSPDGSMLLFETYFGSPGMPAGLYLMSLLGGTRVSLGSSGMSPSFSPDGRRIVFYTETTKGGPVVEVMDRDGSNRRVVFRPGFRTAGLHPRFSPDGSTIVFTSGPSHDQGLYAVGTDGSNLRRLSPHYRGLFGRLAPAILACTGLVLVVLAGIRLARLRS